MESEEEEDGVVITHVSPPPSKRSRVNQEVADLVVEGEEREEPLRCSTPQPAAVSGEELDATLEDFGISHDSIGEKLAVLSHS